MALLSCASALEFSMEITAVCGGESAVIAFGVSPSATNGYDIGIDVPAPPSPMFYAFFRSIDSLFLFDLATDIRSSRDSVQVWDGATANETAPQVTLHWNPDDFPADSGELLIGSHLPGDSVEEWVDMTEEGELTFPVGNVFTIVLRRSISPPADTTPPEILGWSIAYGETISDPSTPLVVGALDGESGIDTTSATMQLNGFDVSFFLACSTAHDTAFFVYSPAFMPYAPENTVIFSVSDLAGNTASDTLVFYTAPSDTSDSLHTISGFIMLSGGSMDLSGSKAIVVELDLVDTTDITGRFEFPPLPADTYTIVATRDGYIPQDTTIYLISDTTLYFVLEPAGTTFVVLDGTVELEGEEDLSGSVVEALSMWGDTLCDTTDAAGFYQLLLPGAGLYYLRASHEGFRSDSAVVLVLADTTVDFYLERIGFVSEPAGESPPTLRLRQLSLVHWLFDIRNAERVCLLDAAGRVVRVFEVGGSGSVIWRGDDASGNAVPAGVYIVVAEGAGGQKAAKKIVLQR